MKIERPSYLQNSQNQQDLKTSFGLNKCNYIMIYVFYFSAITLFCIFAEK